MTKILNLYNTFTKSLNAVELSGKLVSANNDKLQLISGSFYICGPTVYSDSHVGHATTYIRSDLFRRFMKSIFNVRLHTVMNITDIDDKIIAKTHEENESNHEKGLTLTSDPSSHPFNLVSDKYFKSFLDDMKLVRIQPADLYVKVSKHVHIITNFIKKLENDGFAYLTSDGNVCFKVNSIQNYVGRIDKRKESSHQASEGDPRDFVLWKAKKPGEPVWLYKSDITGKTLPGRPGWHVQCSAISSALFGNKLDFHFGGKDLIFPHHYNEEACCCAYHQLDTSKSMHTWANNWLHSGHLVLKDRKMSKSLGNVVPVKSFISRSSVNALRLLCIYSHYRSDIEFDDDLICKLKLMDHKISAFVSFITNQLRSNQENLPLPETNCSEDNDIGQKIHATQASIINGVCDDFHLDRGLESIIHLSKLIYSKNPKELKSRDLIASWYLMKDWCETCGLDYGPLSDHTTHDEILWKLVSDFRQKVRESTLRELKKRQSSDKANQTLINELLKECDNVRAQMDELGFVLNDPKS